MSQLVNRETSVSLMSPWRNWLARSAVNRKVGGSSPPGDAMNKYFDQMKQIVLPLLMIPNVTIIVKATVVLVLKLRLPA